MNTKIENLAIEAYHNEHPYTEYLSSTQLKWYAVSPKYAKHRLDNPEPEKSDALRLGSIFHKSMEMAQLGRDLSEAVAVFTPPTNQRTGKPYGAGTAAWQTAYTEFQLANSGELTASAEEMELVAAMTGALTKGDSATAGQVRNLLKWGKPEQSFFCTTKEGVKLKVRPDLLTRRKIVDWKTVATEKLDEDSLNRIILRYGYHISAAMYQWVVHEVTGRWYDFYLVAVSKTPPHDSVMVDMANYGYRYEPVSEIVVPGPGAVEFQRLLDSHTKCVAEHRWPGVESMLPGSGERRILEIIPPRYYESKILEYE